jgi:pyruvate formate lyase activating enzyme
MGTMRIGGLTPLSTLDFPGELSAVVFCQGCPWRCRYCQNGHLLSARGPRELEWSEVLEFLGRRKGLLDAVVFSGGEPTVQKDLGRVIDQVAALGFKVGLHTAGTAPDRLDGILEKTDWIGLDIKALPDEYPAITGVAGSGEAAWKSLDLALKSGVSLEVRTTWMPGVTEQAIAALGERLATYGVRRFALQRCIPARARDASLHEQTPPQPSPALSQSLAGWFEQFSVRG